MRNLGQHAAGVVVGGCDLVERAVVERRKTAPRSTGTSASSRTRAWSRWTSSVSTLDLIDLTLKYIRKRHSKKVDLLRIPLDDPKVLDNFAKGKTTGIFQFESAACAAC
jgi:DNA polymerase-3 subunit alpha